MEQEAAHFLPTDMIEEKNEQAKVADIEESTDSGDVQVIHTYIHSYIHTCNTFIHTVHTYTHAIHLYI